MCESNSLVDLATAIRKKRKARSMASNVNMGRVKISNPIKIEQEHLCTKCCVRIRHKTEYERAQCLKNVDGSIVVYYDYYSRLGNLTRWYYTNLNKSNCNECRLGLKIPKDPFPLMVRKELVESIMAGDSNLKFFIIRDGDQFNNIDQDWDDHDGIRLVGTNIKMLSSCHPIKMTWAEAVRTREFYLGYFNNGVIRATCDHPKMNGFTSIFDKERWVFSDFGEAFDHNRKIMGFKHDDPVWLISVHPILTKSPPQWVDWDSFPKKE